MAITPSCDIDYTPLDRRAFPPNVQHIQIRLAAEEYDITICTHCLNTKSMAEIIAAAQGAPGGTAEGADSLAYLVRS